MSEKNIGQQGIVIRSFPESLYIEASYKIALSFYQDAHQEAIKAYSLIKNEKQKDSDDLREGRRLLSETEKKLNWCRKLIKRNGFGKVLAKLNNMPVDMNPVDHIKLIVDLYFSAIDPKRIATNKQKRDKIKSLKTATKNLLKEIDYDPLLSLFPDKAMGEGGCHLKLLLNRFYHNVPVMIDKIVPWAEGIEPISESNPKYFAMMMVVSFKIDDSRFLADMLNIVFEGANYDTSSTRKIINEAKKYL